MSISRRSTGSSRSKLNSDSEHDPNSNYDYDSDYNPTPTSGNSAFAIGGGLGGGGGDVPLMTFKAKTTNTRGNQKMSKAGGRRMEDDKQSNVNGLGNGNGNGFGLGNLWTTTPTSTHLPRKSRDSDADPNDNPYFPGRSNPYPAEGSGTRNGNGTGTGTGGYLSRGSVEQERLLRDSAGVEGGWAEEAEEHEGGFEPGRTTPTPSGPGGRPKTKHKRQESFIDRLKKGGEKKGGNMSRTIPFGPGIPPTPPSRYPPNLTRNQKYSLTTFLPLVFYEQFKFFFNLYFLLVALSQFVPALKIGYIATYIAPLAFVLAVTMGKEALDDYQRYLRDKESNSTKYLVLTPPPTAASTSAIGNTSSLESGDRGSGNSALWMKRVESAKLRVGDMVCLEKNMRIPADVVLLRTTEGSSSSTGGAAGDGEGGNDDIDLLGDTSNGISAALDVKKQEDADEGGACFVRTDQLDGETDWKLRVAVAGTQVMGDEELLEMRGSLYADPPIKDIHTFIGNLTLGSPTSPTDRTVIPLSVDNVLWANTVLAAGSAVGMVVYTGRETRASMNTSEPETKVGLLDLEINKMAKILCTVTFLLSLLLVALNGFRGQWYIYVFRFLILFSTIIPISLRVNLDMGKTVYARQIQADNEIPGTIVRTSTLPEELGRIEYLLSDKTGTLTQNEMEMKKLHMGTMSFGWDSMDEVAHQLLNAFGGATSPLHARRQSSISSGAIMATRGRRDMSSRLKDAVLALATCHNVTPVTEDDGSVTYQASSPDEVAIVRWTESVGVTLVGRERTSMTIRDPGGSIHTFKILSIFPFTSESKRMGIILRDVSSGEILFVQKGADVVMAKIVQKNEWLEEECGNMAREGLRTLVIGRKRLSAETYKAFEDQYRAAQVSLENRNEEVARVISEYLEQDLELLALTGVEDKLQEEVKSTLELLRNAGLKIWMLTGDKIETATCIAMSSKLVARGQYIHQVAKLQTSEQASGMLDFLQTKLDCCLVIDGESLQLCLDRHKTAFITLATQLPVVVACRCSPTQKADVARLIREFTKKRVCCIGDGGNDVSMIQAADVGVGIVGKEGKQASLAADFSINQFSFLTKLLLWHGRNSYKRSAKLAQFVIHRGLIISTIQAVFSSIFFFAPIALYQGWLQVGYATLYTMAPVFSLVLDRDLSEDLALLYPELYKELTKGRTLSSKTFFIWLMISIYQGGVIMLLSLFLFESEFINIVSISFTSLIVNELIMVALEITTWHSWMIISELATLLIYLASMVVLPQYFDLSFIFSQRFLWKVAVIVGFSAFPLYLIKVVRRRLAPAAYLKVSQY